jgi:hypothetical protein
VTSLGVIHRCEGKGERASFIISRARRRRVLMAASVMPRTKAVCHVVNSVNLAQKDYSLVFERQ